MTPTTIRAKFTCTKVSKHTSWRSRGQPGAEFEYDAEFQAVTGGSEENERFFKYTPGGTIRLPTLVADQFVPGQDYYVDFTPVPAD